MAKKRKRSQPRPKRMQFNRQKRLQSAQDWIKNYEGHKLVKAWLQWDRLGERIQRAGHVRGAD